MYGLDGLYMGCHGILALKMSSCELDGTSLETISKVRLMEFVFKCLKGYTVTEFKDCFYRGIQAADEMRTSFFQDQKRILSETP